MSETTGTHSVAAFYADENFPIGIVRALRGLGHDALTALAAGQANRGVPDEQVLAFVTAAGRAVLTRDRDDIKRLHRLGIAHAGIIVCTSDPDEQGQASRIHSAIAGYAALNGQLVRVYRRP